MPKISDHQEFLNASMIEDGALLVILNEGEFKDPSITGLSRTVFHIDVRLPDGRTKIWSANKTSQKNLAKFYGDDTAGWVKKRVKMRIVEQNVRGEMKEILYGYPVESDAQTQVPLQTGPATNQLIRFIKPFESYKKEDIANLPQRKADSLINLGFAVPIDPPN